MPRNKYPKHIILEVINTFQFNCHLLSEGSLRQINIITSVAVVSSAGLKRVGCIGRIGTERIIIIVSTYKLHKLFPCIRTCTDSVL